VSEHLKGHRSHASGKRWMQNDGGRKKDALVKQMKRIARRLRATTSKQGETR